MTEAINAGIRFIGKFAETVWFLVTLPLQLVGLFTGCLGAIVSLIGILLALGVIALFCVAPIILLF